MTLFCPDQKTERSKMPDAMYGFGLARTDTQMEAYLASSSLMTSRELSVSASLHAVLAFCPEFVLLTRTRERTLVGPFLAAPPVAPEAGRLPCVPPW